MMVTLLEEAVVDGHLVLQVVGDLDIVAAEAVGDRLADLQSREDHVVVDLAYVPFLDKAGALVLALARNRARATGGHLSLVGVRRQPATLLRRLGLGSMLTEWSHPAGGSACAGSRP